MDLVEKYIGEAKIPSFSEYVNNSDEFKKISMKFNIDADKMGKQKWGDTTRFSGKTAGNRIKNFHNSAKRKQKVLDKLQKEYEKKYNTKVDFRDKMEFL